MDLAGFYTWFTGVRDGKRLRRRAGFVMTTAMAHGTAVYLAAAWTRDASDISVIWPANGILLAALLIAPRDRTRFEIAVACFVFGAAGYLGNGDPWSNALAFPVINVSECLVSAYLLGLVCGRRPLDFARPWTVSRFVAVAAGVPLFSAAAGALVAAGGLRDGYDMLFVNWYLSDTLGILVLTPAILLIWQQPRLAVPTPSGEEIARHFLLLTGVSLIVFVQSSVPLLFLIIPVSVLIAFRLGPQYAAMGTLWLTALSLVCTYQVMGPAALMGEPTTRIWIIQLFCFVNLLTSLAVAAEIADRDRLRGELMRVSALADDRRRLLDSAMEAMSQGICLFDSDGRIALRNSRFLEIYGLTRPEARIGTSLVSLLEKCQAAGAIPKDGGALLDLSVDCDIEQQLTDGRHIRISQRVMPEGSVICTYTDFTMEKRVEGELLHRTLHDVLTDLPNRRLLVERIKKALTAAKRGRDVAVMLIDIDDFKSINDTLGHVAGDELLRVVARRLVGCVREADTVARLGGDEFALLFSGNDQLSSTDAGTVAQRILEEIRKPIEIDGKPVRIGMSIGIARPPADGTTVDEILKAADVALYKAKRTGRGRFAFFDAAEDAMACSARRLESELRRAVEEKEFRVVYQPITSGGTGEIAALEALIRWHHPELGLISPAEFIPLAERNGLISEIGDWVLEEACRDAARLPSDIRISVNLSRVQVCDPHFVSRVSETLARTGLPAARLEFEVTETAVIQDEENARKVLQELQALGITAAIDDFGVGQSALSCLKSLPIGRIKIDRSFISDLASDHKARSVFVAVVSLAKSLGIKTTAEGIETEHQRIIAALAGCDHLQGYLLGRPMSFDELGLGTDAASAHGPPSSLARA